MNTREEALARLENEIEQFEKKYNMSSDEFEKRFGSGDIGCHVDFISWHHANIGLKRLKAGRLDI